MSKLVIKNLPENKELDREALAEFKGGTNPSPWLTQIAENQASEPGCTQPLRGIGLLQNHPDTPHS